MVDLLPKRCIMWGVICMVAGGLSMAFIPHFMTLMAVKYDPSFNVAIGVTRAVSYIATGALFPLGTALIAAAVVMKYVGSLVSKTAQVEKGKKVEE